MLTDNQTAILLSGRRAYGSNLTLDDCPDFTDTESRLIWEFGYRCAEKYTFRETYNLLEDLFSNKYNLEKISAE
jgi:hypothetical protein